MEEHNQGQECSYAATGREVEGKLKLHFYVALICDFPVLKKGLPEGFHDCAKCHNTRPTMVNRAALL